MDRRAHRPQPHTQNYRALRKADGGRDYLPHGRALVIPYQIFSPEVLYMQVTLYRLSRLYVCIYTHAHMHTHMQCKYIITMQTEVCIEFKSDQGRVYVRVKKKRKERGNDAIIL